MAEPRRIGKGFDRVAIIYDSVVRLVFGHQLDNFQKAFTQSLKKSKHTLILGGGSGRILRQILSANQADRITYCEASDRMLTMAKNQVFKNETDRVRFVPSLDQSSGEFDTVILPFVLDCYRAESIDALIAEIEVRSTRELSIVVIDFSSTNEAPKSIKWLQTFFIWVLYQFFYAIGAVETKKLPNISSIMKSRGYLRVRESAMHHGWISASQWTYADNMIAAE